MDKEGPQGRSGRTLTMKEIRRRTKVGKRWGERSPPKRKAPKSARKTGVYLGAGTGFESVTFRLCCKRVMKITQRSAIALPITGQSYVEWDDETKGFGVRVNADGTRSYIAKYRVGARQKKATIGRVDVMKAEAARKAALKLMTAANDGVDVVEREKASERAPTINDVADKFTDEYIPYHCPSSGILRQKAA